MALVLENIAIDAQALAIANMIEDLRAATQHKIAPENAKARIVLARWARDKKAELDKALGKLPVLLEDGETVTMTLVHQAIALLRAERADTARFIRERREQREAELAATQALLAEQGMIAA